MPDNVSIEEQREIHEKLLLHLLAIRQRLMAVDPLSLTPVQHVTWNEQIYKVGLAITAAEAVILASVSKGYADALPTIEKATDKLTDDLYALKAANDVIAAIGSVLGTISSIVSLLG